MSNVLSTVTSPPAAAGVCMLLGGFSDGDSITGHAAAMDDMVASVAGASSEWPTDEDVQTWALFFFLVRSCYFGCICVFMCMFVHFSYVRTSFLPFLRVVKCVCMVSMYLVLLTECERLRGCVGEARIFWN